MKTAMLKTSISLALVGLFFSTVALAGYLPDEPPAVSIDSCVAEIRDNADYSGAGRVRHVVERFGKRSLAFKLQISTSIYDDTGANLIRAYTTRCVVYGDDTPVFFDLKESRDGA